MSDQQQDPQQAGGRLVWTAEATVYPGGRRNPEAEPANDRDDDQEEER